MRPGRGMRQIRRDRQLLVGGVRIGCFLNFDSTGVSGGFGLLRWGHQSQPT